MQLVQKQMEEERARFHRASPYPYTTDYPVVRCSTMYLIIASQALRLKIMVH